MPKKKKPKSPDAPPANRLEQIMKEKFGDPRFGNIMDRIVDEMFKSVDKSRDAEKPPKKDGP